MLSEKNPHCIVREMQKKDRLFMFATYDHLADPAVFRQVLQQLRKGLGLAPTVGKFTAARQPRGARELEPVRGGPLASPELEKIAFAGLRERREVREPMGALGARWRQEPQPFGGSQGSLPSAPLSASDVPRRFSGTRPCRGPEP